MSSNWFFLANMAKEKKKRKKRREERRERTKGRRRRKKKRTNQKKLQLQSSFSPLLFADLLQLNFSVVKVMSTSDDFDSAALMEAEAMKQVREYEDFLEVKLKKDLHLIITERDRIQSQIDE